MGTSVLHIKTEVECRVYLFDEEKGIAKPGTWFNLEVRKGEQDLLFVNTEDEVEICFKSYDVEDADCEYRMTLEQSHFINIDTPATQEEIASGVTDKYGVTYSHDGLQLLNVYKWNCNNFEKIEEYHIQDGCKVIRGLAFAGLDRIRAITIPSSLTHIGDWAFSESGIISDITLPASLTHIGKGVFLYSRIRNIVSHSPNFTFSDGCLVDQINYSLLAYLSDKDQIIVPTSLLRIGDWAFSHCKNLTAVTLPAGLTHIGNHAFEWCKELTSINMPASLTYIGDGAFAMCKNLSISAIGLPDGLMYIGDYAFMNCKSRTMKNPAGLKHLGHNAFFGCGIPLNKEAREKQSQTKGCCGISTSKRYEYGSHYGNYEGSYAQDYAGFSDDVIDDAFEGDPDAYWNID